MAWNQDQELFSAVAFLLQDNHLVQAAFPCQVHPSLAVVAYPFQVVEAYQDLPFQVQVAFWNSCVVEVAYQVVEAFLNSYLAVEAFPFLAVEAYQVVVDHPSKAVKVLPLKVDHSWMAVEAFLVEVAFPFVAVLPLMVVGAYQAVEDHPLRVEEDHPSRVVEDHPLKAVEAYQVLEDQTYDLVEHALDLVVMKVSPCQVLKAFLMVVEGLHLQVEEACVVMVQVLNLRWMLVALNWEENLMDPFLELRVGHVH